MRIIARRTLRIFWEQHSDAEQPLKAWFRSISAADWATPNDVKAVYRSASILDGNRVCFNIAGNKYRLIVKLNYTHWIVYIRFIGTHAEYVKIDANTV